LCTTADDIAAGTRTFRVVNNSGQPVDVTLQNVATGQSISGTAPAGGSSWEVPAGDGANTTQVLVDGQVVATADSTNLQCGAVHGHAECNTADGTTIVVWTVSNNDGSPAIVLSSARGVEYNPNPHAPNGSSVGVEVLDGPASDERLTETVTVQHATGTDDYSATITAAGCSGPIAPVTFTFTKTASTASAAIGDTVDYVYCGQNTSDIPLEVMRLVDDRLGVVIELPGVETVVAPGDTLCNTDLGLPVRYTVTLADAGTAITNHAVVTVRTLEPTPRVFQASATAVVDVPIPPRLLAVLAGDKTWICHRTESDGNPYNKNNVSASSVDANGHIGHAEDIIPPGAWGDGQNYDPANGGIWLNDCRNITVRPVSPTLTPATCRGGVVIPPEVQPALTPVGVNYTVAPANLGDGTTDVNVTVTATLVLGYDWGDMPSGWTRVDARTATWTGPLPGTSCSQVKPADPIVAPAKCTGGVVVPPSLTAATTDKVSYVAQPAAPYEPGQTVTITATLAEGAAWGPMPTGWTQVDATTATWTVTFADASCTEVTPAVPVVTPATCAAGVVVAPEIVTGPTPGVVYARIPTDLGDGKTSVEVTITASVATGYAWAQPLPEDWTPGETPVLIRYTLTLDPATCEPVTPEPPDVTQAVCAGGVVTAPTLTPAETARITYSVQPAGRYEAGQTVTVTATLDAQGVGWPAQMPSGWTRATPTTATFEVTFAPATCTPATPADPAVTWATCTGGVVTEPDIVVPPVTGVTFTLDPEDFGDGTADLDVEITATLEDGFGWGSIDAPWLRVDEVTATLTVTLDGASCDEVVPAAPAVTQAVCVGGVLSPPSLVLAATDGLAYAADPEGPYVPGQSVTVSAALDPEGVAWPEDLPDGWERVSETAATFVVTFEDVPCTPVAPVAPTVTQATCADGAVFAPSIALPTTAGVSYELDPSDLGDGSAVVEVTVTATLTDGFRWGTVTDPWTRVDDVTATMTVTLSAASCDQIAPVAPTVTEAVCAGGVLFPPALMLPTTQGIVYAAEPPGPYAPGATVTVTATLSAAGVAWPDVLSGGWTEVTNTVATYAVTFRVVACTPVLPAAPFVTPATCANGAVSSPSIGLPGTPGIVYAYAPTDLGNGSADVPVTVTAILLDGYEWGQLPTGWTRVDAATATFRVTLVGTSCDVVTPVAPVVTQAVCAHGVLSAPTLVLAETDGIAYAAEPQGSYLAGQSVTVTATLDASGVAWPATLPAGWSRTSDTVAILVVTFEPVSCKLGTPVAPKVTQATCAAGVVTAPTIVPASSRWITYTVDPPGPYDGSQDTSVTVTATVHDGYAWEQMPPGWTDVDPATAAFVVELAAASCEEVTPAAPAVTEAICAGGVVSEPTLTLAETDGITYAADPPGPYAPGVVVTVTATLDSEEVGWPDELPARWIRQSDTTATYTVTFERVTCTPVVPVAPKVTQATCANGVVTAPTIVLPTLTGVVFRYEPADLGDGTVDVQVTVTATVQDGYGWGTINTPWTRADDTTATLPLVLDGASCDQVVPVGPAVTEAVCIRGEVTAPTLAFIQTDRIAYAADPPGPYTAGQTVTVTATLEPTGVAWPAELPAGWTRDTDTTATYAVTFRNVTCHLGAPVAPTVTQATCVNGEVRQAAVVPARSYGIAYAVDPPPPYDPTVDSQVTVTATALDGYGWDPMPPGWTQLDSYRATYVVTLHAASCDEVRPASPAVTQSICAAAVVTAPTLTLARTDGITYTVDADAPYQAGQTVTVTATLDAAGVAWPPSMPPGWVVTSVVTATSSVTFEDQVCKPAAPVAPAVGAASCIDGVLTLPTITLSETTDIVYVLAPDGTTVTASLVEGFTWDTSGPVGFRGPGTAQVPLPEGWTLVSPTQAVYTITMGPAPDCAAAETPAVPPVPETGETPEGGPAPAEPTAPPTNELARSGPAHTAVQLLVAAVALGAGCVLVRLGNRRRV
jgi:hypothetical protein